LTERIPEKSRICASALRERITCSAQHRFKPLEMLVLVALLILLPLRLYSGGRVRSAASIAATATVKGLEALAPNLLHKSLEPALLTDTAISRVKVAAERFIGPGDYVVNSDYGVGQYLGIRMVTINPADESKKATTVASVVIKYAETEISWFQKFVERELWLYRTAESGEQELSSTLDEKKWVKRKTIALENCQGMAANLINLMAIRSGLSRTPSVPTDPKYTDFENR
jgi:hypothetical protein